MCQFYILISVFTFLGSSHLYAAADDISAAARRAATAESVSAMTLTEFPMPRLPVITSKTTLEELGRSYETAAQEALEIAIAADHRQADESFVVFMGQLAEKNLLESDTRDALKLFIDQITPTTGQGDFEVLLASNLALICEDKRLKAASLLGSFKDILFFFMTQRSEMHTGLRELPLIPGTHLHGPQMALETAKDREERIKIMFKVSQGHGVFLTTQQTEFKRMVGEFGRQFLRYVKRQEDFKAHL
ncbi:hypothetical protein OAN22_01505 [Alphaproteobacteria bacterium]|nr:hypothetical protein [Alphaproteobacteria bacterium]